MTDAAIQQQLGFRRLRFLPELEQDYLASRNQALRIRARPVTASALLLLLAYAGLDLAMLPPELARQTLAVRLLFAIPMIALVWALSYSPLPARRFVHCYGAAYLAGGLSVVAIIGLARQGGFPLPYDGILLILMFGYFVMGLPFRTVSLLSLVIILAYLATEALTGMEGEPLIFNAFFLLTANIIGMVGSWLSEYRQRAHFLDRQLLEQARRQAEQESARNAHLITVASHDLRQPLNVIGLMLDNLSTTHLPATVTPMIDRLKTTVTHFNNMLTSVLDISRIQEGMVRPEPVPLRARPVLQQLYVLCLDNAAEHGVTLELLPVAQDLCLQADPQLLHRILHNLLTNALEHSQATRIQLSAEQQPGRVCLAITDNGRGIPPHQQDTLFEPFTRGDPDNSAAGLGLGLAIVRALCGQMAGLYGADSRPGAQTRFWVSFPAATMPEAITSEPQLNSRLEGPLPTILLVEDHPETRRWMQLTLQRWGYPVQATADAEEAMAALARYPDALLVTDMHLRGASGLELIQRRAGKPAILVTADTQLPQGLDESRNLWTLHKPVSPLRLRTMLRQAARSQ